MDKFAKVLEILKKGLGEGSRGGHIIGHTSGGHPIYSSASHPSHQGFRSRDHRDAMNHHYDIWTKTHNKIQQIKEKRPNWNPPKQIHDFLAHHHTQMRMHSDMASRSEGREQRSFAAANPHGEIVKSKEINPFYSAVVVVDSTRTKLLVGKRKEDGTWTSPAGGAKLGESPKRTAVRESFEEANLKLEESQLIELPMGYTFDHKPVHCFVAVLSKEQMEGISTVNDPDKEVREWKWHPVDSKLPEPMTENRFGTFLNAKMHLCGLLTKSYEAMDEMDGMTVLNTADHATESAENHPMQATIESVMLDYKPGDEPRSITFGDLDENKIYLVCVDEGLYSGYVKRVDDDGLEETVARIDKMTVPALIQYLKAKEIIKVPKEPHTPEQRPNIMEYGKWYGDMMDYLSNMIAVQQAERSIKDLAESLAGVSVNGNLNITIQKAKALPVGTVRQWGPYKYVKHADGWVVMGGEHHGKLMGNFQSKPTHADFARHHENTTPKQDEPKTGASPKAVDEGSAPKEEPKKEAEPTPKSIEEEAQEGAALGKKAFEQGKKPVPAQDPELMKLLQNRDRTRTSLHILQAYTKAWHQANLAAPVPEPEKPKEEPKAAPKKSPEDQIAENNKRIAELEAKLRESQKPKAEAKPETKKVYHGTFQDFDPENIKPSKGGKFGPGIYVAENEGQARNYGDKVHEYHATTSKVFDVTEQGKISDSVKEFAEKQGLDISRAEKDPSESVYWELINQIRNKYPDEDMVGTNAVDRLNELLKKDGYEGVKFSQNGSHENMVLFDKKNIKVAKKEEPKKEEPKSDSGDLTPEQEEYTKNNQRQVDIARGSGAHTMSQKDFVEHAKKKRSEELFQQNARPGPGGEPVSDERKKEVQESIKRHMDTRSRSYNKDFKERHKLHTEIAVNAGFKDIHPDALKDYPGLGGTDLPEGMDNELNKKTNLIKSIDLGTSSKAIKKQFTEHVNNCNKLVEGMGLKFKTALKFKAVGLSSLGKRVRGTYMPSSKTIELKDMSDAPKTIMHEIGHALDYAMQHMGYGGRHSEQMSKLKHAPEGATELHKLYGELHDAVTQSDYYKQTESRSHLSYLVKPTEVFARAFEVYSFHKAQEMDMPKEFMDTFIPDVFRTKDPEIPKIRKELDDVTKDYVTAIRASDESKINELKEKRDQLSKQYNERIQKTDGGWGIVSEEKQAEYKKKVSEVMAKILSKEEIRKALAQLELATDLLKSNELMKAKGLPIGTVRLWNGQKFMKHGDGHWMPLPSNQQGGAQSQPQSESKPASQPKPEAKQPGDEEMHPTEHLKPKEGFGGHVELHSQDLEHSIKHGPTSIISAGRNPNNEQDRGLTDDQVNERYKRLEQDLKDKGYKYTKVKGHYGGEEESYMVHHADEKHMNELGKKYNQDSVIHTKGGKNKLHFTTGEHEGKHHKGEGFEYLPEAKDYYSEVKTTDGQKKKFNLGLDFGKHHEAEEPEKAS